VIQVGPLSFPLDPLVVATFTLAAVGALAFIANVILAIVTGSVARATRGAAQAAKEEAAASRATVDEMRRDRDLAYRPYLSWRVAEISTQAGIVVDNPSPRVVGANFGRGPVLHCLFVAFWPKQMIKTRSTLLFDVSPNQDFTPEVRIEPRPWTIPHQDVAGPQAPDTEFFRIAFCQDQLGNTYRFVPFQVAADVWRPSDARPTWLEWYEQRRTDLEKI